MISSYAGGGEFCACPEGHASAWFAPGRSGRAGRVRLNQQVIAQSQVSGDIGYGVVVDGAPFNNGGYSFDEVVSSFTVSGLDQLHRFNWRRLITMHRSLLS